MQNQIAGLPQHQSSQKHCKAATFRLRGHLLFTEDRFRQIRVIFNAARLPVLQVVSA